MEDGWNGYSVTRSVTKTLKRRAWGVCETEIKHDGKLVTRKGTAWGRAYICTMMNLLEEKNDRVEMKATDRIDYNKSHPRSRYYFVSATLPSDVLTLVLWLSSNKAKWNVLALLFRWEIWGTDRLGNLTQLIKPVTDRALIKHYFWI